MDFIHIHHMNLTKKTKTNPFTPLKPTLITLQCFDQWAGIVNASDTEKMFSLFTGKHYRSHIKM